jgi:FkbH-like protein
MTGQPGPTIPLALLSSSGTQLLADAIRTEMRTWGWDLRIWQSGFNQYRQDIANPGSPLYLDPPQILILHLDGEDLFADCLRDPFAYAAPARLQRAKEAANEVERYVATLQERLPETVVILNTVYLPPVHSLTGLEYHTAWGLADLAAHYNGELAHIARQSSNVLVNDVASLAFHMGYGNWFDPRLWYLARCRLSGEAMKALARQTGSLLRGWKGLSRKCLVLDLDNTLWGGVIGEDGIAGIVLGEEGLGMAFTEFQQELLNLSRKGVLLAICSKNNEEDALEVLRRHPSMRLGEDAFAATRINWRDKATNLRELAEELNIGLDSLVFIDDNPVERCLVKASLPEVHVPDWPGEPACFKAALLELAGQYFPRVAVTAEDRTRAAMYRAEGERRSLAVSTGSLDDYYRSLEMRAEIGYADPVSTQRIAQLTQKTNQFNLTTRRYTETEIRTLAEASDSLVMWLRLRDRFSDNGIVGVLILRRRDARSWAIDTFLMSCRVIGRTVENAFLGHVCHVLKRRGAGELIGEYVPTRKNNLAVNLYRDLGFEPIDSQQGTTRWRLPLNEKPIPIPEWIVIDVAEETAHA